MDLEETLIDLALYEDLHKGSDITTLYTVPAAYIISAEIRTRKAGIVAGIDIAERVFVKTDPGLGIKSYKKDGQPAEPGETLMLIEGKAASVLKAERTALNFLGHLSGIATLTGHYVAAVAGTKARIMDTRKTLPGLRGLQKAAVKAGGGFNHRHGLYDAILIKDNHITTAGGIKAALDVVKEAGHTYEVQIEVDNLQQLQEVMDHGGADIVLLDNMDPDKLCRAVSMVNGQMLTEASGGVNLETVAAIAQTGVDRISIGALTHSAPNLDIGLDISDASH